MPTVHRNVVRGRRPVIDHQASAPPVPIPRDHVGEFVIPGSGRRIWWTGRVAVGLHYQREPVTKEQARSARWVQALLLADEPIAARPLPAPHPSPVAWVAATARAVCRDVATWLDATGQALRRWTPTVDH